MKKMRRKWFSTSALTLCAVMFTLASCSGSDDNQTSSNSLTLDGERMNFVSATVNRVHLKEGHFYLNFNLNESGSRRLQVSIKQEFDGREIDLSKPYEEGFFGWQTLYVNDSEIPFLFSGYKGDQRFADPGSTLYVKRLTPDGTDFLMTLKATYTDYLRQPHTVEAAYMGTLTLVD